MLIKDQNLKLLATFSQKDIFPALPISIETTPLVKRLTGKAVLFDECSNIALVGTTITHIYLLPGGGIQEGESITDGVIRECLEETGCIIQLRRPVGIINDFRSRDNKYCITYCYLAELVGSKGIPALTEEEKNNGLHVIWLPLNKAIEVLAEQRKRLLRGEISYYNTGFNIVRDYRFLVEAREAIEYEENFLAY